MDIKINGVLATVVVNPSLRALTYVAPSEVAAFLASNPGWSVLTK